MDKSEMTVISAIAFGAIVGLGKLLNGGGKITWRQAVGRMIVTGGLGGVGGLVLLFNPALPPVAVFGFGAAAASLGTSFIEAMIQKYLPTGK